MLDGLACINVELTNRCNKGCWMCGRRKIEKEGLSPEYGDMSLELVKKIAPQLPKNAVVQFHSNGESLMYPMFGEAIKLFSRHIKCIDTNGKLIVEKAGEIINNLDTITISTFEGDKEADEQYELIKRFLQIKGDRKPNVIIRCLGRVDADRYKKLGCIIATRALHSEMGSFGYTKPTAVPEIGICLDFLHHLCINKDGDVSICARFDPKKLGVIGNLNGQSLADIWNSEKRKKWLNHHVEGKREMIPLCKACEYWGVPASL